MNPLQNKWEQRLIEHRFYASNYSGRHNRYLINHVYITIVTSTPFIESCQTRVFGRKGSGEVWSNKGPSQCSLQHNMYGKFQVSHFISVLMADLTILIKEPYNSNRPNFVSSELFGVTDVDIRIRKIFITGI